MRSQLTKLPSLQPTDLSERTVMIVGANVGLGLEAIRHLAGMPQPPKHLIIACRSKSKGEAAIAG
jgi:retinol dehydrogenase-12